MLSHVLERECENRGRRCECVSSCLVFLLQKVQQNGSLYIHIYFTKSGFHPDPKRKGQYRRLATVHSTRSMYIKIQIQKVLYLNNTLFQTVNLCLFYSISVE